MLNHCSPELRTCIRSLASPSRTSYVIFSWKFQSRMFECPISYFQIFNGWALISACNDNNSDNNTNNTLSTITCMTYIPRHAMYTMPWFKFDMLYTNDWIYHAIPYTMPCHIPCRPIYHAMPHTMPCYIPCHAPYRCIWLPCSMATWLYCYMARWLCGYIAMAWYGCIWRMTQVTW